MLTNSTATLDSLDVANRLRPVLLRLNRELRRELAGLGITAGQAALLHAVRTNRGVGVRELAAREGISAPGMSAHVDRLETAGLVRRIRSETDRRRVGLELTEQGERAVRAARRRRTAWLAQRLKRLSDAELAAVDAAIAPLLALVGEGA